MISLILSLPVKRVDHLKPLQLLNVHASSPKRSTLEEVDLAYTR